ncbi:MAG: hypothetical protein KGK34_09540 [Chloroflexota bacterium]|nr:hypothetical protein [Chloroflexota bacterium]
MPSPKLRPGSGLIFMKVGTHAREPLPDIIARKRREIEEAGRSFWGYGGATCHPLTTVQPFARDFVKRDGVIYLCMQPMDSHHFALPARAREYSADGVKWQTIPDKINVRGSRYALIVDDLRQEEFELPLERTRVAVGNSVGRPGSEYITGRVDKACLEFVEGAASDETRSTHIGLVARLVEPYAVLVRS